jgi:hypothetical protein
MGGSSSDSGVPGTTESDVVLDAGAAGRFNA